MITDYSFILHSSFISLSLPRHLTSPRPGYSYLLLSSSFLPLFSSFFSPFWFSLRLLSPFSSNPQLLWSLQHRQRWFQSRDGTKLNDERYFEEKFANIIYQSVVCKVEGNLQQAADTGHHCDPQVDLSGLVVWDVFFLFGTNKPDQEVMPDIDLAHFK